MGSRIVVVVLCLSLSFAGAVRAAVVPDSTEHKPGSGLTLVRDKWGSVQFSLYTNFRYLNQNQLDPEYTDAFGQVRPVNRLHDFQLSKVNLYFRGWLLDPRFRYMMYTWTSNSSQGNGAQVVVGGNLQYRFSPAANLGFGIASLPGTYSTSGSFPFWLGVDNRVVADEFFRPSYTSGIWLDGALGGSLQYQAMLGNNLSQLGIDAGQLDSQLSTYALALSWTPTGEFGRGMGDFERHETIATRVGLHYTSSNEDAQSQPSTEAPENSQIRLSDGSLVFTPGLFGPGIAVRNVAYHMAAVDAGAKVKGVTVTGEFYWRRLDDFGGVAIDQLPFARLEDRGFTLRASAMAIDRTLMVYGRGSRIDGGYGDPWDVRGGANFYPWRNQTARWNFEVMYLRRSPVGALSLPYVVGGNGTALSSFFEVNF